jgi:hypothetical protein
MEALKDSVLANTLRDDFRQQLMDYKFISFFETLLFGKVGLVKNYKPLDTLSLVRLPSNLWVRR